VAARSLSVRVVSPQATVFQGEASSVVAPAWDGQVGILPGHSPLLSLLGGGMLSVTEVGGNVRQFFVNRGVMKVDSDTVTVLSEYAGDGPPAGFDAGDAWMDAEEFEVGADGDESGA
jgi:F-type H+-transporting ATPase subunit epsilon